MYETPQSMFELQESMQVVLKSKNSWEPDFPQEKEECDRGKELKNILQEVVKRLAGEDAESFQFTAVKSDAPPEYTELVTETRFTTEADTMMSLLRPRSSEE